MPMKKIYVTLIEGTIVYVPVDAIQLNGNNYRIVANEHEDSADTTLIWQFFPGDVVRCSEKDGNLHAVELITSDVPMRKMHELIFLLMYKQGRLSDEEKMSFSSELKLLFSIEGALQKYPALKEWIVKNFLDD